jgi:hypothetical protein
MTRYCGRCGAVLEPTARRAGYCPACGTALDAVDAADTGLGASDAAVADPPTLPTAGASAAAPAASPANPVSPANPAGPPSGAADPLASSGHTSPALPLNLPQLQPHELQPQHRRRGASSPQRHVQHGQRGERRSVPPPWALLLSAVLLLLAGAAVYALGQRGSLAIILAPFTSSNANASSNASSAAGGNTAAPHAPTQMPRPGSTPAPGASPTPRGSPTPSPGATPSPTATGTPAPPTLSVSPTTIPLFACVAAQTQFTITNTGGQVLTWSVSASVTGYQISPGSGSIDPGLQETVTVSNILQSGIVTVSAPGARNAPQQVSITCTV